VEISTKQQPKGGDLMGNLMIGDFDCEPILKKISDESKKINEATDKARKIILKIEAGLSNIPLDRDVWDDVVFPKEAPSVSIFARKDLYTAWFSLLGFVKIFAQSGTVETYYNHFVIKRQLFSVSGEGKPINFEEDLSIDLLSGPETNRNLLIASIPYIPGLLVKIQEEIEKTYNQ
jgi:hypothetical protein